MSGMRSLAAHPDWSFYGAQYSKQDLLEQRNCVFARHPQTRFIGAHVGESPEDLGFVTAMLERFPNVTVDMSSRVAELGRQPYSAREFFLKFPDRILFGTDLLPDVAMYRLHYRFFETADEYFDYPSHASRQGRWMVYGIFLPDEVLRKVYRENTLAGVCREFGYSEGIQLGCMAAMDLRHFAVGDGVSGRDRRVGASGGHALRTDGLYRSR